MTVTQTAPPPPVTAPVTPPALALLAALWDSIPLDALLGAAGARLREIPDEAEGFLGSVRKQGARIEVLVPAGRPGWQQDMAARDLLARVLDVELPGMEPTKQLAAA